MRDLAKSKKGKCLSDTYVNIDSKLEWECDKGHRWETRPYLIRTGSWCPKCNVINRSRKQRASIEEAFHLQQLRI